MSKCPVRLSCKHATMRCRNVAANMPPRGAEVMCKNPSGADEDLVSFFFQVLMKTLFREKWRMAVSISRSCVSKALACFFVSVSAASPRPWHAYARGRGGVCVFTCKRPPHSHTHACARAHTLIDLNPKCAHMQPGVTASRLDQIRSD